MRVGILTFHTANNYGAVLQACALVKAVAEIGHHPIIIDYRPAAATRLYRRWGIRSGTALSTLTKRWRFHQFRKQHLPLSRHKFFTLDDFGKDRLPVDVIITGSDQVWNTASYRGYDPTFFLPFADSWGGKRVSYAASVGSALDFGSNQEAIASELRKFEHLSVRDVQSKALIQRTCGRTPEVVLDPVFLTDMDEMARMPAGLPGEWIAVYCLAMSPEFDAIVQRASSLLGIPAVSLGSRVPGVARSLIGIGPAEWLACMIRARLIVTNSFHGVCFAIKHQKPFVVHPHKDRKQNRINDMLTLVGLESRIAGTQERLDTMLDRGSCMDYSASSQSLAVALKTSREFLHESLT